MLFVVHPVTWKVLCKPAPRCRHEQQLQEALSCLSRMRAGTSLVPGRARLASLHSWEKEIFVYCQEAEARPPTSRSFAAAPALPPGLACLAALWGPWGPRPKLGFFTLHQAALRTWDCSSVHSPDAETVGQLLGDHWAWCPDGSALSFFHLCRFLVLMETP